MRTPIAYYGGKQAIIGHLRKLVPQHTVYTELFFGGGTLFWAKEPAKNETINDRLELVINFYRQLKTNFQKLRKLIDLTLYSRHDFERASKIIREPKLHAPVHLAWAFWFKSNTSYMFKLDGGFRFSNDKYAASAWQFQSRKDDFTEILKYRIERTYIECSDALRLLTSRDVKQAFHYLDPPYFNSDQGHYKGYSENDFIDLLDQCKTLKGKFLLSNYNSHVLDDYINRFGWNKKEITHRIKAPRKSGLVKTEVLVWNYISPAYTKQYELYEDSLKSNAI